MKNSDTTAYERILDALGSGIKPSGNGYMARCPVPAHDDRKASLSVSRGDSQPVILNCHAGCEPEAIVAALGLEWADVCAPRTQRVSDDDWTPAGRAVAKYDYRDENGKLLFQVCRTADKGFPQRRPDPTSKSGWRWNLTGTRRVLYRLPEVLGHVSKGEGRLVYICEGEKDVHTLEAAGLVATCNPGGAGKWRPEYNEVFRDAVVTIVADKDEPGRRHAEQVRDALLPVAAAVYIVEAAEGCKDATAHVAAGHSLADLIEVWSSEEPPPQDQPPANPLDAEPVNWPALMTRDLTQADWLGGRLLERGQQMALLGEGKVGKSLFCFEWALHLATGRAFLGDDARDPVKVLYIDAENTHVDLQRRMAAQRLQIDLTRLGNLVYLSFPPIGPLDTREGALSFAARVLHHRPDIVFIDTISRYIEGNENDASTWQAVYRLNGVGLKRAGIASVRLDHFGKDTTRGGRGSSAKTQDIDHVWELTGTDPMFRLKRTHTRSGISDGDLSIRRHGAPGEVGTTYHELMPKRGEAAARVEWLGDAALAATIAKLDEAGIPDGFGRERLREAGLKLGIQHGTDVWSEIARRRKERLR